MFELNTLDSALKMSDLALQLKQSQDSGFLMNTPETSLPKALGMDSHETELSDIERLIKDFRTDLLNQSLQSKVTPSSRHNGYPKKRHEDELISGTLLANSPSPLAGVASSTTPQLTFSDLETGRLDSTDLRHPTNNNRYRDDYLLTGMGSGQQVTLSLNTSEFNPSIQLVNAETGVAIASANDTPLTFTAQQGIEYVVRVTSATNNGLGDYSLGTTLGQLSSGTPIANQTLNGYLHSSDPANNLRSGRYYDGYFLSGLTPLQQVTVTLNASNFDAYLQLVNADTGALIDYNDDSNGRNSFLSFTVQSGVDYMVRATSYRSGEIGNYSLIVNSTFSTNGAVDGSDDARIFGNSFAHDEFALSDLQTGEQVQLNLSTTSSLSYIQLVNGNTGAILTSNINNPQVNFTVQAGIDYRVRVIDYANRTPAAYNLTTNYGTLYDTNALSVGQTINATLAATDSRNPWRTQSNYDGYWLKGTGTQVEVNLSASYDTYLYLVNPRTGEMIAYNDDIGGGNANSRLIFNTELGTNYLLLASSYVNTTGNYTIAVNSRS